MPQALSAMGVFLVSLAFVSCILFDLNLIGRGILIGFRCSYDRGVYKSI